MSEYGSGLVTAVASSMPLSLVLFWIALAGYCAAFLCFVLHTTFQHSKLASLALGFVLLGWGFNLGSIITRGLESGHWPLGNMYEYSTAIAFMLATIFLGISRTRKTLFLSIPLLLIIIALMGVGYSLYEPPAELIPALQSYWLMIHVTAMATASSILSFSFFFGMTYLARKWADARQSASATEYYGQGDAAVMSGGRSYATGDSGGKYENRIASFIARGLPEARTLDRWSFRAVMIGFPVWTFGVMCGAIWGELAWGTYWGWDPKETFAFITWVIFAIYLHARVTYGWKEKKAAIITGFGFVSILITLYAVNLWIVGLHSYARA